MTKTLLDLPTEMLMYIVNQEEDPAVRIRMMARITETSYGLWHNEKNNIDHMGAELKNSAFRALIQAVIDGDKKKVKRILDSHPDLLLWSPAENHMVTSQLSWLTFYAETALTMAVKRKQIEMIGLMLPYFDKISLTEKVTAETVMVARNKALAAWTFYVTEKNDNGEDEIVIPPIYAHYAQSLIHVLRTETFPNNNMSKHTDYAPELLFGVLLPDKAIKLDDYLDPELFLLALYEAYCEEKSSFQSRKQRDAFCIRVIGLVQSVLSPETAKIFCEGLYWVVSCNQKISHRAVSLILRDGSSYYRAAREGCDLDLISSLPNKDEYKAIAGKIYLSQDGAYVVRDLKRKVHTGTLGSGINLSNLPNRLHDSELKKQVVATLARRGVSVLGLGFEFFVLGEDSWGQEFGVLTGTLLGKIMLCKNNNFQEHYAPSITIAQPIPCGP